MQVKDKTVLHLIQGSAEAAPAQETARDPLGGYQRRIKTYAERIRSSQDVEGIVRILELALNETAGLHRDQSVELAREEVQRAERRIAVLRDELEEARRLVQVDHLTGTLNRAGFENAYIREAALADRYETSVGVALIDLDNFKSLNDIHGHQAGDAALIHLACVLKRALRPSDSVARFGGEEFLLLLPHATVHSAARAVERVQAMLATHVLVYQHRPLRFTFSAGVAERKQGEAQAAVVARADRALYLAKNAGKHRVVQCA